MTCHEARERFSALLDDALAGGERAALDAHLAGCAECRRELERFRATVTLLHRIEPARAPAGFVDRVLDAARPAPWYRRLARAVLFPLPVKLPLEAAAVVLVGVIVTLLYRQTPELQRAFRVLRQWISEHFPVRPKGWQFAGPHAVRLHEEGWHFNLGDDQVAKCEWCGADIKNRVEGPVGEPRAT